MRLRRLRGPVLGPQPQHDNEQLRRDYAYRAEAPDRQLLRVQLPEVRKAAFGDLPRLGFIANSKPMAARTANAVTTLTMAHLPSRVALPNFTPPDNRPSHYYRRAAGARRYPRPAVSESVLWWLRTAALLSGTATTANLGQCPLPQDGSGMTVLPFLD